MEHSESSLGRSLLHGLAVTIVLVGAKVLVEHTALAKWLMQASYAELRDWLPSKPAKVVVLDISEIPPEIGDDGLEITSRDCLDGIVQALADAGAAAVAIDIDFAPEDGCELRRGDGVFLRECSLQSKGEGGRRQMPVFLGVYRSRLDPPDRWLGALDFADLAGHIMVDPRDVSAMPGILQLNRNTRGLRSLAVAVRNALPNPPQELTGLKHRFVDETRSDYEVSTFLVDYSVLDSFLSNPLTAKSAADVREIVQPRDPPEQAKPNPLKGAVVLLGRVSKPAVLSDVFHVPGQDKPIPGVLLLAAAVHTLSGHHLYLLSFVSGLGIDLLLCVAAIVGVWLCTRRRGRGDARTPHHRHRLEKWTNAGAAFIVVLLGIVFAIWLTVFWFDFVLVAIAMLVHPSVDRWIEKIGRRLDHGRRGTVAAPATATTPAEAVE